MTMVKSKLWAVVIFIVSAIILLNIFGLIGDMSNRLFNAGLLLIALFYWLADYTHYREMMYRRQRRLRLAFAFFLFSGTYGSLETALNAEGSPTKRIILISISGGALLASMLYNPADDLQIPDERVFFWERWILKAIHKDAPNGA